MKSKFVFGLLAMMLVLALAPSSFAQVQIIISNTPSSQEIQTNRHAQVADVTSVGAGLTITGALVANSPLTTTTLTLTFPAPITSGPIAVSGQASGGNGAGASVPSTGDGIRIEGGTGVFASVTAITTMSFTGGTITITLPGFDDPTTALVEANTLSGSFRLLGVRIDANGKTAPLSVTGALSSSANNYFPPTSGATVINALGAGISAIAVGARSTLTSDSTATIFTNRTVADPLASFTISEGFASAWRGNAQLSGRGIAADIPNSTNIRLTFSGIPTGVTLTLGVPSTSTGTGAVVATNTAGITATTNTSVISFSGSPSLTSSNTIDVRVTAITVSATATLTPGTITVTATMTPIGDALSSAAGAVNTATTAGGFPAFAQADVGPITLVNIIPSSTTMLIPFAVRDGAFDTGISIANTTADPFGTAGGGATASSANLTVSMFPRTSTGAGSSVTITTSSTIRPGIGLGTDGTQAAGGTWTVLLSELWAAAGQTGSFTGYIFIQANYPNAHGSSFVSDFRSFTSFSPVLILPAPATTSRTAVTESLGL